MANATTDPTPSGGRNTPYADEAEHVWNSGLGSPLPVPYGQKGPPPVGYTGHDGLRPSWPDVMAWIEDRGGDNICVRLSPEVIGIDVDAYGAKRGAETLAALEAAHGPLPATWKVTSRTDGVSGIRLYRIPTGLAWPSVAGPGIEIIRAGHRYLMWRGSVNPDTNARYRVLHAEFGMADIWTPDADELPDLPDAWVKHLTHVAPQQTVTSVYTGRRFADLTDDEQRQVQEYARQQVTRRLQNLRDARTWTVGQTDPLGRGWEKLTADTAQTLRTLVADGWSGLDEQKVRAAFLNAAPVDATWTRDDAEKKWHNQSKPAINGGRIEFPVLAGMVTDLSTPDATSEHPDDPDDELRNPPIDWAALLDGEDEPPQFLVGMLCERGQQVALVGAAKVGKSLLSLDWAAAIAAGKPFLADDAREPLRVMYVDHENTRTDLRRRARALGLTPPDLARLTYLSFPAIGALDTVTGAAALLAEVARHSPDVIFLDTVSRMIQGAENDSDTWLNLYRLTLKALKARGIAVIRLDHFGKDTERGARGSSAKDQDVDHVFELKKTSETDLNLKRTHSRTGVGPEYLRFRRVVSGGDVRHICDDAGPDEPFYFEKYDMTVRSVVNTLDAMHAPEGLGRDALKKWAIDNHAGVAVSNATWSEVVKLRAELAADRASGEDV